MFRYRQLQPLDIPVICSFPQNANELFFLAPQASWPLTEQAFAGIVSQRQNPTVVLLHDRVVGFACLHNLETSHRCFVDNIIIAPQFRGQGIGRALVEQMTAVAIDQFAIKDIHLSCFNNNINGLFLYVSLGFKAYFIEERTNHKHEKVVLIHLKKTALREGAT